MTATRLVLLTLSLGLAFTLGLLFRPGRTPPADPDYEAQVRRAAEADAALRSAGGARNAHPPELSAVADRLRPSVVSIFGVGTGLDGDPSESTGTGIVVDAEGHVLTNHHVVAGLDRIEVTLASRERFPAELVGADPPTDLAVLRVRTGSPLLPAEFGDSDALVVGQEVLAMGNAYGFGWSVSHGIISSLHRTTFRNRAGASYTDYIQTDAAINPGNSGGPLVDLAGKVIGVNSVIVSESGASAGLGFALPSRDASFVARELVRHGRVERGYLGVKGRSLAEIPRGVRDDLGVATAEGVFVDSVDSRSPAENAGFQALDVILTMDGRRVVDMQALRSRVARSPIGTPISFTIVRGRQELRIAATPEFLSSRSKDS